MVAVAMRAFGWCIHVQYINWNMILWPSEKAVTFNL